MLLAWGSTLIFDVANQGTNESLLEDSISKPRRPNPSGRLGRDVISFSFDLDVQQPARRRGELHCSECHHRICFWVLQCWLTPHCGRPQLPDQRHGLPMVILTSCFILTMMQVQDFNDQIGDTLRNRRSCPTHRRRSGNTLDNRCSCYDLVSRLPVVLRTGHPRVSCTLWAWWRNRCADFATP